MPRPARRPGRRCRRSKNCSNGVPLNGFWRSSGSSSCRGCRHASTVRGPGWQPRVASGSRSGVSRSPTPCASSTSARPRSTSPRSSPRSTTTPSGGLTLFVGRVRDHDGGQDVDGPGVLRPPDRPRRAARGLRAGRRASTTCTASPPCTAPARLAIGDIAVDRRDHAPRHRGEAFDASRGADRHAQGRGADLEAPAVRRRHRGVGRLALSAAPAARRRWRASRQRCRRSLPCAGGDPALAGAAGRRDVLAMVWVALAGPRGPRRGRPRRRRPPPRPRRCSARTSAGPAAARRRHARARPQHRDRRTPVARRASGAPAPTAASRRRPADAPELPPGERLARMTQRTLAGLLAVPLLVALVAGRRCRAAALRHLRARARPSTCSARPTARRSSRSQGHEDLPRRRELRMTTVSSPSPTRGSTSSS